MSVEDESEQFPPFQEKPKRTLSYKERARKGLVRYPQRKQPLRKVSKARTSEQARYNREAPKWLIGKVCCVCGGTGHLSVHHTAGRGRLLNEKRYWKAACLIGSEEYIRITYPDSNLSYSGGCHGWIEANKKLAETLGLITRT